MSKAVDLSCLDADLRAAARFTNENREVMWPRAVVDQVIDSLEDHGFVVFGLDLRSDGDGVTAPGLSTEIPISAFHPHATDAPTNVEEARAEADKTLRRPDLAELLHDYEWVLITSGRP